MKTILKGVSLFFVKIFKNLLWIIKKAKIEKILNALFYDLLKNSQAGFKKISAHEIPTIKIKQYEFPLLFANPHSNTKSIQHKIAEKLFSFINAQYLPTRLIILLNRVDAFQAVVQFLSALNLTYSELISYSDKRILLNKLLYILLEVDELIKESGFDDKPLYEKLCTHEFKEIEAMAERLRKAVNVYITLKNDVIVFRRYKLEFLDDAIQLIRNWSSLDDFVIEDIYDTFCVWKKLQNEYDQVNVKLIENLQWIEEHSSSNDHQFKALIFQIRKKIHRLNKEIEQDVVEIAVGIEELKEILEDLISIRNNLNSKKREEEKFKSYEQNEYAYLSEQKKEMYMAVLELGYPEDFQLEKIKKNFRKLAMKCHPDKGGNPEKFREIYVAYKKLTELLDFEKTKVDFYA
ncbi:DnaJ domain-containing protein [Calditrichota bacterium GD2]